MATLVSSVNGLDGYITGFDRLVRTSNGILWALVTPSSRYARLFRSSDNGATWTEMYQMDNFTSGGLWTMAIDGNDVITVAGEYGTLGTDGRTYLRIWAPDDATRLTYTLVHNFAGADRVNGNNQPASVDVVAHSNGNTIVAYVDGTSVTGIQPQAKRTYIGIYEVDYVPPLARTTLTERQHDSVTGYGLGDIFVRFEKGVTGLNDSNYPPLHVVYREDLANNATRINYARYTWNGTAYSRTTSIKTNIDDSSSIIDVVWDGTSCMVFHKSGSTLKCSVYTNQAFVQTITLPFSYSNYMRVMVAPDGLFYVIRGSATTIYYRTWNKVTNAGGSQITIDTTSATIANLSPVRRVNNQKIDLLAGPTTTNANYSTGITLNRPPTAPTNLSIDGRTLNRAVGYVMTWTFNDPDAGDTQSAYQYRYRLVGAGSWTTPAQVSTPTRSHTFASNFFAVGNYELQLRTRDAQGVLGPYSASAYFAAAEVPSDLTVTSPSGGETLNGPETSVEWSTPAQTHFETRRVADDGGDIDESTVYQTSGQVTSVSARAYAFNFATNSRWEWIQVRIKRDGLWSNWTSVRVFVSYTPPLEADVSVTPYTVGGKQKALRVAISHPTPDDEPEVESYSVWREKTYDGDNFFDGRWVVENNPAATTTLDDYHVEPHVTYRYRVDVRGDNGATTQGSYVTS